jgi:hypothetical protein
MKKTIAAVAVAAALALTSYKIDDKTWLVRQAVAEGATNAAPVVKPTNHYLVLDCSGSMYCELPQICSHLESKLPSLLGEHDTITIIWFSGRGQFGTFCEGKSVHNLAELEQLKKDLRRWLRTVGATGFKEPIEELKRVVGRVSKAFPKAANSGFFLSDGGENSWPQSDVLKAIKDAAGCLDAFTVVEYGNYADRAFLTQMAQTFGGTIIQAASFQKFDPIFSAALGKRPTGAKRVSIKLDVAPIGEFAYLLNDGDLVTYGVEDGKIAVPADATEVFYLSPSQVGADGGKLADVAKAASAKGAKATDNDAALAAAYAATALYAQRMEPNTVLAVLSAVGDVSIVKQYGGCFGSQAYAEMADTARAAAFGKGRFLKGYDAKAVPPENAFCVRTLLDILQADAANRVLLDKIEYKRIGLARADSSAALTENDIKAITLLNAKLVPGVSAEDAEVVRLEIDKIIKSKGAPFKFVKIPVDGYTCTSLVYNETRANIGINTVEQGTIDIASRIPTELKGKLPDVISTFRFKTKTIVKDGIRNMDLLPVRVTDATFAAMKAAGYEHTGAGVTSVNGMVEIDIDLAALPIINRKMVKATSAKVLAEKSWALIKEQARAKVYKDYAKTHSPKESAGFVEAYGKEAEEWLKSVGISESGGFNPKGANVASVDFYLAKTIEAKVAGYSSLPSVNDVKKRIAAKGKQTTPGELVLAVINECEAKLKADPTGFAAWIATQSSASVAATRNLIREISAEAFGIIVGQVWFTDLKPTEASITLKTADGPITVTFEKGEKEEKI